MSTDENKAVVRRYYDEVLGDGNIELLEEIAIADYGLHSAVKAAVTCERAGVQHIDGLRVRVVAERAYRAWGERSVKRSSSPFVVMRSLRTLPMA